MNCLNSRTCIFRVVLLGIISPIFALCAPRDIRAEDFELKVQRSIENILPSVLAVQTDTSGGPTFGAGFVVDQEQGLIVTNYHVVSRMKSIKISRWQSNKEISCKLVYFDAQRDLALLKSESVAELPPPLKIATEFKPKIGQFVIAVGSPGGYDFSASLGIVSAIDRQLQDQNSRLKFLQIDAPLYHGSSGGPLSNLSGEVIGVNSRGGASNAVGFAIPAPDLVRFIADFREKGSPAQNKDRGFLGVVLQALTPALRRHLKGPEEHGVLLSHIYPKSSAAQAGFRVGDIITRLGELEVSAPTQADIPLIENYILGAGPGPHALEYYRDGRKAATSITLASHPPCESEGLEIADTSLVLHKGMSCYLLPDRDYVEVIRYSISSPSGEFPKAGDLIIAVQGQSQSLGEALMQIENTTLGTVLRAGLPRLVLLAPTIRLATRSL